LSIEGTGFTAPGPKRAKEKKAVENSHSTNKRNRKWNSICKSNQIEIRSQSTAYTKI